MDNNPVRTPQQKRSIEKKERILKAAYTVFCKNGYYNTNTTEIAAEAGVSIGCLYSYFKDKHAILLETLGRYQQQFEKLHELFFEKMKSCTAPATWFREFMEMLIEAHDNSLAFQRELKMLYYCDPDIAAMSDAQQKRIQAAALKYISLGKDFVQVDDVEATAIVSTIIMSSVVDRISLSKNDIDRERILNEGVKAVCRYMQVQI
jgi:AcrR family transcriptional regulator